MYVDYGERPIVVHARLVLAAVDEAAHEYIIMTPDFDIYLDVLDDSNPDFTRFFGAGPRGGLPRGVSARNVYGFAPISAGRLGHFMQMGREEAAAERGRRGGGAGDLAPPPEVAAAAPPLPDGEVWVLAEMIEGHKIGETVEPPNGHPEMDQWGLMNMEVGEGARRPCLIHRIARDEIPRFCEERVKMARISEALAGEDRVAGEDVRTMSVIYDANGDRRRGFKETVGEMRRTEFEDFPFEPRTVLEYLKATATIAESCLGQHLAWAQQSRIPEGSRALYEDEALARIMDVAMSYDALNISNLACFELLVRRRQLIAEAHPHNPSAPSYEGADYYMGTLHRPGGAVVVPKLTEHVSRKLQADSQILKERRKLEEARKQAKGDGSKGHGRGRGDGAPAK